MEESSEEHQSILISAFSKTVEWGNRWLTLANWIFTARGNIFIKLEIMMIVITLITVLILVFIHLFPPLPAIIVAVLLAQRVLEFLIVYSRNFILNRGRIFSRFHDKKIRGQWLILMFMMNIIQILFIFSIWYRLISLFDINAFSRSLGVLDSLYFSTMTFLTVGYGDIVPMAALPKVLVIIQALLTFYTIVIVINGLISIHFFRSKR